MENKAQTREEIEGTLVYMPQVIQNGFDAAFAKVDTNNSGVLTKDEAYKAYVGLWGEKFVYSGEHFFSAWFNAWDTDAKGSISKEDLKNLMINGITKEVNAEVAKLGA